MILRFVPYVGALISAIFPLILAAAVGSGWEMLLLTAVLFAVLPTSAGAIIGGQPDGNNHPYVAYADNGVFACSTTLLSPTVMLTAAHCFSDSTSAWGVNTVTGGSIVRATFDPDLTQPNPSRVWHWGTYYFDPQFAIGSAGGLPGFDMHDEAIIGFTSRFTLIMTKFASDSSTYLWESCEYAKPAR